VIPAHKRLRLSVRDHDVDRRSLGYAQPDGSINPGESNSFNH